MTIIVFLLDTSASMNQRISLGGRPTLFDAAKSAVEQFVKVRQRSPDSRGDRYMLLTFEEPPNNVKAGWKENLSTFMSELKNLQATGLTTLNSALRHTFDILNVNRMQHGIDTYGQGRCPFYLEPCIIVVITDGGSLCTNSGVINEIKLIGSSPGAELTREPFRWDQRLFSLVLRMNGQPNNDREIGIVPSDASPIDSWCEITGGRSYCITTHRMLLQCIDSLVSKVQAGVVLHFEKVGADPPPLAPIPIPISAEGASDSSAPPPEDLKWTNCHKMIYVPRTSPKQLGFAGGFWPIPESFWPEASLPSLASRSSHPNLKFSCAPTEPIVIENFPFDKYELEPSPLTQYLLARKQSHVAWQVFIPNSSKGPLNVNGGLGCPFGYLKCSTSLSCVNLFVMPYNYPLLLPLLDDLIRVFRLKPTNEWRAQFNIYLNSMPPYYAGPLKRALLRIGAGNIASLVPEENYLSYSVLNYLKKLKSQAKVEFERLCGEVGVRVGAKEYASMTVTSGIGTGSKKIKHVYKNPFDIPRDQLLDHLNRLRAYFFRPGSSINNAEFLHNQPVAAMGNYQEFIKRMPQPLRELESTPVRQHMFGNPFKIDKKMIVDEAIDIDLIGGKNNAAAAAANNNIVNSNISSGGESPAYSTSSGSNSIVQRVMKRKPGPISKDFIFVPKKYRRLGHGHGRNKGMDMDLDTPLNNYTFITSPSQSSPGGSDIDSDSEYDGSSTAPSSPMEQDNVNESSPSTSPSLTSTYDTNSNNSSSNLMVLAHPVQLPSNRGMNEVEQEEDDEEQGQEEVKDVLLDSLDVDEDEYKEFLAYQQQQQQQAFPVPLPAKKEEEEEVEIIKGKKERDDKDLFDKLKPTNNKSPSEKPLKSSSDVNLNNGILYTQQNNANANAAALSLINVNAEETWRKNLVIRTELHKEIRRPRIRKDYLLGQLSCLVGCLETKLKFITGLEREAARFKRKSLIHLFEEQRQDLIKIHSTTAQPGTTNGMNQQQLQQQQFSLSTK